MESDRSGPIAGTLRGEWRGQFGSRRVDRAVASEDWATDGGLGLA